jgi:hypothetical protein
MLARVHVWKSASQYSTITVVIPVCQKSSRVVWIQCWSSVRECVQCQNRIRIECKLTGNVGWTCPSALTFRNTTCIPLCDEIAMEHWEVSLVTKLNEQVVYILVLHVLVGTWYYDFGRGQSSNWLLPRKASFRSPGDIVSMRHTKGEAYSPLVTRPPASPLLPPSCLLF